MTQGAKGSRVQVKAENLPITLDPLTLESLNHSVWMKVDGKLVIVVEEPMLGAIDKATGRQLRRPLYPGYL
jgi:hypothetical protein